MAFANAPSTSSILHVWHLLEGVVHVPNLDNAVARRCRRSTSDQPRVENVERLDGHSDLERVDAVELPGPVYNFFIVMDFN